MSTKGYFRSDPLDSGMPAGRSEPAPGEVRQAVADVDCKAQTHLVERWRSAEARTADRLEQLHQRELVDERRVIVTAVAEACSILRRVRAYAPACGELGQPTGVENR